MAADLSLFQLYTGLEFPIFPLVQQYSEAHRGEGLANCANVSLVLLGIIENPRQYLDTCTDRRLVTEEAELSEIFVRALANGGYEHTGFSQDPPRNVVFLPVDGENSFGTQIWKIGQHMENGFSSLVGFIYENNSQHMALLLKVGHTVILIDAQTYGDDGGYPLILAITEENKDQVRQPGRYPSPTRQIIAFLGPKIPEARAALVKFDPTSHEGPLMNTSGGRRKLQKKKTRKTKKKTRKASR